MPIQFQCKCGKQCDAKTSLYICPCGREWIIKDAAPVLNNPHLFPDKVETPVEQKPAEPLPKKPASYPVAICAAALASAAAGTSIGFLVLKFTYDLILLYPASIGFGILAAFKLGRMDPPPKLRAAFAAAGILIGLGAKYYVTYTRLSDELEAEGRKQMQQLRDEIQKDIYNIEHPPRPASLPDDVELVVTPEDEQFRRGQIEALRTELRQHEERISANYHDYTFLRGLGDLMLGAQSITSPRQRRIVGGQEVTTVGFGIPGFVYALFEIAVVVAIVFGKYYVKIDRKSAGANSKT